MPLTSNLTQWFSRHSAAVAVVLTGTVALVLLWPMLLTGQLLGGDHSPDTITTIWSYWWSGQSMMSLSSPLSGSHTFFPLGHSPITDSVLDGILFAPLFGIFDATTAFSIAALLCVWSAGVGAWMLARAAGASPQAAVIAGVGLQLSPVVTVELQEGRLAQALVVFWLLALAGMVRLARGEGSIRLAVATGAACVAAVAVDWHRGVFLAIAVVAVLAAQLRTLERERLIRLGVAAGIALLFSVPLVVMLVTGAGELQGPAQTVSDGLERFHRGERSLSSAINNGLHWQWPVASEEISAPDRRIGLGMMVMAGLALFWKHVGRLRWLAVAAAGYILALGPYLKSAEGAPLPWALPYRLLHDYLPGFSWMWWPGRAALITVAAVAVLAALGLDDLGRRMKLSRRMLLVAALILSCIDMPWRATHLPLSTSRTPATDGIYAKLDGPILTTPVLGVSSSSQAALWHQMTHGQPILYGPDAYIPANRSAAQVTYIKENSLLNILATGGSGEVSPEDVDTLIADGFVWAVIDTTTLPSEKGSKQAAAQARLFKEMWGEADLKGQSASAWRIESITDTVQAELLGATTGAASSGKGGEGGKSGGE